MSGNSSSRWVVVVLVVVMVVVVVVVVAVVVVEVVVVLCFQYTHLIPKKFNLTSSARSSAKMCKHGNNSTNTVQVALEVAKITLEVMLGIVNLKQEIRGTAIKTL